MIPFANPNPGELINLNHIVRATILKEGEDGEIEILFANGTRKNYKGKSAAIVSAEINFCILLYRQYQTAHSQSSSGIVTPDGSPPQRIM